MGISLEVIFYEKLFSGWLILKKHFDLLNYLLHSFVLHFSFLACQRVLKSGIIASIYNQLTHFTEFAFSWYSKQRGIKEGVVLSQIFFSLIPKDSKFNISLQIDLNQTRVNLKLYLKCWKFSLIFTYQAWHLYCTLKLKMSCCVSSHPCSLK
jgi:hypothetical protein